MILAVNGKAYGGADGFQERNEINKCVQNSFSTLSIELTLTSFHSHLTIFEQRLVSLKCEKYICTLVLLFIERYAVNN